MIFKKSYIRAFLYIVLLILVMASFSACSSPENDAKKVAENFLKQIDTFHDVNKIIDNSDFLSMQDDFAKKLEPYMTSKGFDSLYSNRMGYIAVLVGFYSKSSTDVENVKLELMSKSSDDVSFSYNYIVDVKLTPLSGDKANTVQAKGQMTVEKDNGSWKISIYNIQDGDWMKLAKRAS